jgi:hypothetical protein
MTGTDFLCSNLALLAWRDGFSEGLNGMLAVAHTIKRRVDAGWYNGDWASVLSNHKKWSARTEPYSEEVPDPRIYSFQCLLQEVNGIFNGSRQDDITVPKDTVLSRPAPGALYYGRLDAITSEHFLLEIARKPELHPRVAQVGMLTFFA